MSNDELNVGDHIWVEAAKSFFKIINVKPFTYKLAAALTAGETVTNTEITQLNSALDEIFNISGIEIENNIRLWLKFRGAALLSTGGEEYITQDDAPKGNPFPLDLWAHNKSPFYNMQEMQNLAVTSNVFFTGITYDIETVDEETKKRLMKLEQPYLSFKGVHG
jgi:hypothetical protein